MVRWAGGRGCRGPAEGTLTLNQRRTCPEPYALNQRLTCPEPYTPNAGGGAGAMPDAGTAVDGAAAGAPEGAADDSEAALALLGFAAAGGGGGVGEGREPESHGKRADEDAGEDGGEAKRMKMQE
jgi:hypothetical protein